MATSRSCGLLPDANHPRIRVTVHVSSKSTSSHDASRTVAGTEKQTVGGRILAVVSTQSNVDFIRIAQRTSGTWQTQILRNHSQSIASTLRHSSVRSEKSCGKSLIL